MTSLLGPKFRDIFDILAVDWIKCDPRPMELLDTDLLIPTIYFLTDRDSNIQYIGQSKQLALRIAQHRANPKMRERIDWQRTFYISPGIENKSKRLRFEGVLISLFSPPGNKVVLLRHCNNGKWAEIRFKSGRPRNRRLKFTRRRKSAKREKAKKK